MKAKRAYALLLTAAMVLGAGTAPELMGWNDASLMVSAATSGTYGTMTYTMYDDYVEITGFDNSISTVTIPSKIEGVAVTRIGDNAFKNATKLESVTIPNGVTEIGVSAFYQCTLLQNVSLPSTLTSIGEKCFENSISLQIIEIPDNTLFIGNAAFAGCVSLLELEFPEGSEQIGNDVASGCTSLRTVTINNGPTLVGARAFDNCTSLKNIYLPISITNLQNDNWDSFENCSVQHIYYAGTIIQWNAVLHKGGLASATIHYGADDIPAPLTPDVNNDGSIDATDAAYILQFAAYVGAGGELSLNEYYLTLIQG